MLDRVPLSRDRGPDGLRAVAHLHGAVAVPGAGRRRRPPGGQRFRGGRHGGADPRPHLAQHPVHRDRAADPRSDPQCAVRSEPDAAALRDADAAHGRGRAAAARPEHRDGAAADRQPRGGHHPALWAWLCGIPTPGSAGLEILLAHDLSENRYPLFGIMLARQMAQECLLDATKLVLRR